MSWDELTPPGSGEVTHRPHGSGTVVEVLVVVVVVVKADVIVSTVVVLPHGSGSTVQVVIVESALI